MKRIIICILLLVSCILPARAWRISNELKEEVADKKAIVAQNPTDPQANFELAITYAYTNNIIEGMSLLKKVVQLDPTFKDRALPLYIEKVNTEPNDWKLRFRLAFAYYFNEQRTDAVRELKNVLIIDPNNVWAHGYLALIYGELDNVDLAMAFTKKGLAIDNNVAALHLLLAEGYYKKGDSWRGFLERMEAVRLKALGF
ncbi:MAG: tetratricopeptide repeat protein [bacterium]